MKKLLKFFSLPPRRRTLFVQSFGLVWTVRVALWLFSFKRLNKWMLRFDTDVSENRTADWREIEIIADSVRACSRYVPQASCLTQAFAAGILLRRNGQDSRLKIGVSRDRNDRFTAHAWVEINERIVIGRLPRHERFNVLNSCGAMIL